MIALNAKIFQNMDKAYSCTNMNIINSLLRQCYLQTLTSVKVYDTELVTLQNVFLHNDKIENLNVVSQIDLNRDI